MLGITLGIRKKGLTCPFRRCKVLSARQERAAGTEGPNGWDSQGPRRKVRPGANDPAGWGSPGRRVGSGSGRLARVLPAGLARGRQRSGFAPLRVGSECSAEEPARLGGSRVRSGRLGPEELTGFGREATRGRRRFRRHPTADRTSPFVAGRGALSGGHGRTRQATEVVPALPCDP
jgi:hypothetical protein